MAQMVLGAIGAVIGGYFGGPQGAAAGWAIGSSIGAAIDPTVTEQTGPRLSDLNIQVSTWGTMIPELYGTMRTASNVIWASPIRETTTTTSESAKGGPSVETTTYSYSVDVALLLCQGPIEGVRRIWANNKLIYNAGIEASIDTVIASQQSATSFTVYTGSDDQLPDATIEAYKGVGNVPAYRGRAYVVFHNFQLADYGNRMPNFEFEVIGSGFRQEITMFFPSRVYEGSDFSNTFSAPSIRPGQYPVIYHYSTGFPVVDLNRVVIDRYQLFEDEIIDLPPAILPMPAPNTGAVGFIEGVSDVPSSMVLGFNGVYYFIDQELARVVSPLVPVFNFLPSISRFSRRNYDLFLLSTQYSVVGRVNIATMAIEQSVDYISLYPTDTFIGIDSFGDFVYVFTGSISGTGKIIKLNRVNLSFVEEIVYTIPTTDSVSYASINDSGEIFVKTSGSEAFIIVGTTGSYVRDVSSLAQVFYIPPSHQLTMASTRFTNRAEVTISKDAITGNMIPVSGIVSDQCEKAGLSTDDIDLSQIDDLTHGYIIKRQGSARANISQLQIAYLFDAVESEYKIKFPKRGSPPVAQIPWDQLGAQVGQGDIVDPMNISRALETDLPRRVTVNYVNLASDYLVGSEHEQRLVTESVVEMTQELAIALQPDQAASLAAILLYDAHNSRTKFGPISLSPKYCVLEPTDVIEILSPVATYTMRLASKTSDIGIQKFDAVLEDITVYGLTGVGASDQNKQEQIQNEGPTRALYLDIPLVRDEDNNAGFYAPMSGLRDAWSGATLFSSIDNMSYLPIDSVSNNATIGFALTVLGDHIGGNFFDEKNTVDVQIFRNQLFNASYDEVMNGANCILIGNELLQFKNAELIDDFQYRLSGLLRGRRGTEQYMVGHAQAERVCLMTVAGTLRPNEGTTGIGAIRYYKPVSIGQKQTDLNGSPFINTAVGLKPYSVVNFSGGKQVNGDFLIAWTRRGRLDGGWRNSVDVPIGEESEAYQTDILDGGTVVRTIDSTTPSVTYTSAQQITDFGSPQSSLSIRVYQMSSIVGRGFAADKSYP